MKRLLLPLLLIIPISLNANTGSKSSKDDAWNTATTLKTTENQETEKSTTKGLLDSMKKQLSNLQKTVSEAKKQLIINN